MAGHGTPEHVHHRWYGWPCCQCVFLDSHPMGQVVEEGFGPALLGFCRVQRVQALDLQRSMRPLKRVLALFVG